MHSRLLLPSSDLFGIRELSLMNVAVFGAMNPDPEGTEPTFLGHEKLAGVRLGRRSRRVVSSRSSAANDVCQLEVIQIVCLHLAQNFEIVLDLWLLVGRRFPLLQEVVTRLGRRKGVEQVKHEIGDAFQVVSAGKGVRSVVVDVL